MNVDLKALKLRADIVAVLRSCSVPLESRGANFVALCPFHREKTPSFTVDPKKRIFKCFGCSVSGDVFKFVKLISNLTLPQAIQRVQALTDGPPPPPPTPAPETMTPLDEDAIDRAPQAVLDRVIAHWQRELARSTKAQEYLTARGLWRPELVRALRIGYCSGSLTRQLPGGGKLRRQLCQMGILNERGNEFFYGRIVIPVFGESMMVGVYGRAISGTAKVPHLYLKGRHRGVFNAPGIHGAQDVILTEAPLDALSLMALGFTRVTTSYGAGGFTADIRAQFVRSDTKRVYCAYDADPTGDQAAEQLAHDLAGHGIEVLRVAMPAQCKDPNDFLRGGGTREEFQTYLDRARPVLAPAVAPQANATLALPAAAEPPSSALEPAAAPATEPAGSAEAPTAAATGIATVTLGDRTYLIESAPEISRGVMRVVLRATRKDRTFVDTLNLYADHARAKFVSRLVTAFRGQVPKKALEEDFFAVLDEVETLSRRLASAPTATPTSSMTPAERDEALELLKHPRLTDRILEDFVRLGVVGEDDNKLLAYLVATSRKLGKPLSLSVISRASAGKSWLLNVALDLMPPEEVLRYTRMSPRALFYAEPGRYKNKILFIEEAIGAKDADLGVRSMQSEKRLSNLVTMTDPKTGQLKTQETVVEGPLTYITSSVDQLDHETATRSFEIAIDESSDQTARVVARQFYERTIEGIQDKLTADAILARHRNTQRLLEALVVANPYAPQLTFPADTLRLRREAGKYLSLMDALALLHQHQRPVRTFERAGQVYRYVEVTREDVDAANRLMASCLARALSDLTGPAEKLLLAIRDYVLGEAEARGGEVLAVTFSRREIRERLGWSDHHAIPLLEELVQREYVEAVSGSFGKRYVYTLTPDHRLLVRAEQTITERITALGLKPADQLIDPSLTRPQSDLAGKR